MIQPSLALIALTLMPVSLATSPELSTQRQRGGGAERERGPLEVHEAPEGAGIAWFGTWDAALEEAKRTQRPILFMSAAPQCQSVPGVW